MTLRGDGLRLEALERLLLDLDLGLNIISIVFRITARSLRWLNGRAGRHNHATNLFAALLIGIRFIKAHAG